MVFAKALQSAAAKKGIEIPIEVVVMDNDPDMVPRMYRAQIRGRCQLQNASSNDDWKVWTEEWVDPINTGGILQPRNQNHLPALGNSAGTYRIVIEFPQRVATNCNQDNIFRPVIGKLGIPWIPGSSIKGLFLRLSTNTTANLHHLTSEQKEKIKHYCGSPEKIGHLRFHGAYPVGDWAGMEKIKVKQQGKVVEETIYRIMDLVHPQQFRQVQGRNSSNANAMISFYKPKLVFELSSRVSMDLAEWEEVESLLRLAVSAGLGGKTSTGYGLIDQPPLGRDNYNLVIPLQGTGVSSLLRSDIPEFRPNQFKATIRGHVSRLLGGVCQDQNLIDQQINFLFGHHQATGNLNLYWDSQNIEIKESLKTTEATPIAQVQGKLLANLPTQHADWLRLVFRFAYIMGGFGKSWRRSWHRGDLPGWHPGFMPSYQQRAIGCHWECNTQEFVGIQSEEDLKKFLAELYSQTQGVLSSNDQSGYMRDWREAWHPRHVQVYAVETTISKAIHLFHDQVFKFTPAVGGRAIRETDKGEQKDARPTFTSSVWHRMLPINDGQYIEIVTVFKKGKWEHLHKNNIREEFVEKLRELGLSKIWGI
jgi:CRISPR-associated protein Cmr6